MAFPNRMPEINLVMFTGRLTRDAANAFTQKGTAYSRFDIAVGRRYMDSVTNEWKEETVFVPAVLWGQQADRLKDRLKKGVPVMIEGRLQASDYQDKTTGQMRKGYQVNCSRVQILVTANAQAEGGQSFKEPSEPVDQGASIDDDVPF